MNSINMHTVPAIQTGISKKATSVSWLSDDVSRDKNSFANRNTRWDKDFKKRK